MKERKKKNKTTKKRIPRQEVSHPIKENTKKKKKKKKNPRANQY